MNQLLCMMTWLMLAATVIFPGNAGAQDTTTFFIETFDGVTPPDLPAGWNDPNLDWETNASVASTGSGLNNLRIAGTAGGTVQTALIDLSGMTSGTLQYLARRTSSYALDSLVVRASANGGVTFAYTLLDRGQALPLVDAAYELVSVPLPAELLGVADVQFQFEALGGSTSGANVRIDDVEITGAGEPPPATNQLGFATDSSVATGAVFDVPLVLDFSNAAALQGIQLEITWDAGLLSLTDVIRGAAIADTSGWQVNFDSREGMLRVVILGEPATALVSGSYNPLMTLQLTVDAANTASSSTLTISRVLGALSVRTGDDAGLALGTATHTVTLASGTPVFAPDATTLDLGVTDIQVPGTAVLTVSNTGDADLVISSIANSNGLFDVSPAVATITAGGSELFTVSFTPVFENFGYQASDLTFTHNAVGGTDVILLTGTGTGGRGDMNIDGLVDVSDLVLGIDYVLETLVPDAGPFASADVYPFALPDNLLDVRDLTVLSQAIVFGNWPDDSSLPVLPPAVGKADLAGVGIELLQVDEGNRTVIYLDVLMPVRAFQFSLKSENAPAVQIVDDTGINPFVYADSKMNLVNVLGARMTGGVFQPGRYPIIAMNNTGAGASKLAHGVAVSENGERVALSFAGAEQVAVEDGRIENKFSLETVFPNPFVRHAGYALQIPFNLGESQHVEIAIFDILGRQVAALADQTFAAGRHVLACNFVAQNLPYKTGVIGYVRQLQCAISAELLVVQ